MDGYLGVSCNGVTNDFGPFSALLAIHKMSGRHIGGAIFSLYQSTQRLEDFGKGTFNIVI